MSFYSDASLVFIPSGYKASKAYSAKPTDGTGDLTFTRSNDTATRVGPDGLIEKVRTNLLLQSNTFSTSWANNGSTETSGQAGYDGSNDAWLLTSTTTSSAYIDQSLSTNSVVTLSVYAKANTVDFIELVSIGGAGNPRSWFNLASGSVGTSYDCIDTKIEAVSGATGWYRCSITLSGTIINYRFYAATSDNSTSIGIGDSIYLQDAQVEAGDIATDYIATTSAAVSVGPVANVPRLDYTDSTCPRLLLEPQRTNKQTHSEQINLSNYGSSSGINVTENAGVSPDGYTNADKIIPTTASAFHQLRSSLATSNGYDIVSVFVKASGYNYVQLTSWADPTNYVNFDLTDGTVGTVSVATIYGIQSYGNGWYRVWANVQASGAGMIGIGVITSKTAGWAQSFAGNGTDGVLMWGVQIEAGAYATSYIPTLGAAVTRGADAASKTGISSLIGQTEGVMFIDFVMKNNIASVNRVVSITESNWLSGGSIRIDIQSTNITVDFINNNGSVGSIGFNMVFAQNTRYKIAVAYKTNDCALYMNGTQLGTNTSTGAMPTCSELYLNELGGGFGGPHEATGFNQALLFKTRLSNADLAALTA